MSEKTSQIGALLHEAGETHHLVYRIVDGDDPDWVSWYANWLINLSELPQILGTTPVRSEPVWLLVTLDKEYTRSRASHPRQRLFAIAFGVLVAAWLGHHLWRRRRKKVAARASS